MEEVILVNEQDEAIGTMEKLEAHRSPHLHRAFSVFLFNNKNQMLLQQRALKKYHSGGLWTNTCCSHPRPGEEVVNAAYRRLREEMGINQVQLSKAFEFVYNASFENGLCEYEYDHVFIGTYSDDVLPNTSEVASYCYKSIEEIKNDIQLKPQMYTAWFKIAIPHLETYLSAR